MPTRDLMECLQNDLIFSSCWLGCDRIRLGFVPLLIASPLFAGSRHHGFTAPRIRLTRTCVAVGEEQQLLPSQELEQHMVLCGTRKPEEPTLL
jgi:hypothetical protein